MLLQAIAEPLTAIKGIDSYLPKLARLGIRTIPGLLCHYPRERHVRNEVTVVAHDYVRDDRRQFNKLVPKVYVEGKSGIAALFFYKHAAQAKQLVVGERFQLWGRSSYNAKYRENRYSMFEFEPIKTATDSNRIRSFYRLTSGLTNKELRPFIRCAVDRYAAALENEIPAEIAERDKLLSKADAMRAIHFPASFAEFELANKTLIYEELFYLEMMVGRRALERRGLRVMGTGDRGHESSPLQQRLLERLPFSLTPGQERAISEINADMAHKGRYSMARLLQGDVGSGKTLVSCLAALRAVDGTPDPRSPIPSPQSPVPSPQ
jgi:ATP-dependent DNA helicase RecG